MPPPSMILDEPRGLPADGRGTVVTVGTFDGVHRGHWAVLNEINARAAETGRRTVLATFDPHPLAVVRPEVAPRLLTTVGEKKEILAESGLDYAVFLRFTPELAQYSPRRFVEEILVARIGVEELVIGYDHGFGKGRSGDAETLHRMGTELGFEVDVVGPVEAGGDIVSSTRIRAAVSDGDVESARAALGRPYSLRGTVVRGDGRGRDLGFPTANLEVGDRWKLIPAPGIYAVRAVLRGGTHRGALHLGPRPTFEGARPSIELFLLDFDREIYGEIVRVDFVRRLRPVLGFDSVDELVRQMERDAAEARQLLESESGLFPRNDGNTFDSY